jgi:hypothetical protein
MPGARLQKVRIGDKAELLAAYLLEHIAFVTSVPRQEDVGHDLVCSLIECEGNLLKAGLFFTMQIKSKNSPIVYKKIHEREWISKQENPFFIGVADCKKSTLDIYSTWNMLNAFLKKVPPKIRLILREPKNTSEYIKSTNDNSAVEIYLGKPILSLSVEALADKRQSIKYAHILKEWISLDRENITCRAAKMYWVIGPSKYKTNQPIQMDDVQTERRTAFYWNIKNFPDCVENFLIARWEDFCVRI